MKNVILRSREIQLESVILKSVKNAKIMRLKYVVVMFEIASNEASHVRMIRGLESVNELFGRQQKFVIKSITTVIDLLMKTEYVQCVKTETLNFVDQV